jgi:hypothetical protein
VSEPIRQMIEELAGVASARIDVEGDTIVGVRVELADGADERTVATAIRVILERHGYRSRVAPERVKLEPESPPSPPEMPTVEVIAPPVRNLHRVIVEEDRGGVTVTVVDSGGGRKALHAGTTTEGRTKAIVDAVSVLVKGERATAPRLAEMVHREDGVLLVVLEDGDGSKLAGASVVRSGLDFALAAAVWAALTG